MRVRGNLPAKLLDGQQLHISNDAHFTNARVTECRPVRNGRSDVGFARASCLYQGGAQRVDAEAGFAVLDLPPYLYDYHPAYYEGMTAVSERGAVLGKASVTRGGRFMYLGYPEWHRHTQQVRPGDITDADGDGRRTLRVYAANDKSVKRLPDGTIKQLAKGEHMLVIEVTGVSEDGLTVYYKDHPMVFLDSIKAPHRGWPYHRQIMRNEAGTRQWVSKFPGDAYHLSIRGRKLRPVDLPDVDRNGRPMVRLHDFGPGDRVRIPTHVYVRRTTAHMYEVRADVGFAVTMGARSARISTDGKTWHDVPSEAVGDARTFRVGAGLLGDGKALLRVTP